MSTTFGFLLTTVLACLAHPFTAGSVFGARCPRYWDFGIHKPITCGDAKGACRVLDRARNRIKTDWKPNRTSRPLDRLKVQTSAESTNAVIRGFESCHV